MAQTTTTLSKYRGDTITLSSSLPETFTFPEWRGPPSLTIITEKGGNEINEKGQAASRLQYDRNNRDLILTNAIIDDSGDYQCTYPNHGTHTIKLTVNPGGVTTLSKYQVDTFTLSSSLPETFTFPEWRGPPSLNIITNLGENEINEKAQAASRLQYDSNNRDLILTNAAIDDSGDYQCTYPNHGTHTIKLTVNPGGVTTSSKYQGDTFTLSSSLPETFIFPEWRGPPSLTIITNLGEHEINEKAQAASRLQYDSNNRDLILTNAAIDDSGDYQCTHPAQRHTIKLTVNPEVITAAVGTDVNIPWKYPDSDHMFTVSWEYIDSSNNPTTILLQVVGSAAMSQNGFNIQHNTNGDVTITAATVANTGTYRITVTYYSATPTFTDVVVVNVYDPPTDFSFTESHSDSQTTFTCTAGYLGDPAAELYIQVNGEDMKGSVSATVSKTDTVKCFLSGPSVQCMSGVSGTVTSLCAQCPTPDATPDDKTSNTDAIVGGTVGGVFGLGALVVAAVTIYSYLKKKVTGDTAGTLKKEVNTDEKKKKGRPQPPPPHIANSNQSQLPSNHDRKGRGLSANYTDDDHPLVSINIPTKKACAIEALPDSAREEGKQKKKRSKKNDKAEDDDESD